MKIPLSWIKDFVEIELPIEELARQLTMAGLEVEELVFVGLRKPSGKVEIHSSGQSRQETKISGIEWDADKIVVGAINEVMPHPNADRLVLCRLDDGQQEHIALTGAPNLFPFKGQGPLPEPIKVAYAREGAKLYDGHQPGQVLMTLKRTKIRGVDSYSMACSEKELGISEEHEGVIILDPDAPVGMPLVDYMGDVVLDIAITPNIARDANILGVAREIAALTGKKLKIPDLNTPMEGPPIEGLVNIEIQQPELNPRFVLGLVENIEIRPSPYEVQRRLRLAGMRPINNIVDATNYAMLEIGEPLHAFDHDILKERADGKSPTIITRTAEAGERITTLDGVERYLDDFTVLVCDTAGPLSIAGVMGGAESEVNGDTRSVLLEGAAWNFTNIRRTLSAQNMSSEAAYRFSRGVHPSLAERGVRRGLELMRQWANGIVSQGLVDNYPMPPADPTIEFTVKDVQRWLGISLDANEIAGLLRSLEFTVHINGEKLTAITPDHRLDIGEGIVGVADLIEEIARIYGYDLIPETRLSDELPPQRGNRSLEIEERLKDILANLGLQEVIAHRLTTPEREALRYPQLNQDEHQSTGFDEPQYVRIANPIASDRNALRQSLIPGILEIGERNARLSDRMAYFEVGEVFLPEAGHQLPEEPRRIAILLSGTRSAQHWQVGDDSPMDFFDMKGVITQMLENIQLQDIQFERVEHPTFHPGKCASVKLQGVPIGLFGEVHPLVKNNYDLPEYPVMAAELDVEAIQPLVPDRYNVEPVPVFPPVLEDLAVVVDESVSAERIADLIRKIGGVTITKVKLFDVYRGGQAGPGKKSLAFNLTYQKPDRTLTDEEVARIRQKIVKQLDKELGARLRS
jgi:phenylalanyl-tRNA synthetase beta chain